MDEQPDFDMVIQRHLTRAHRLHAIQQMIAEDPGIVPDLLEILSNPNPATAPTPTTTARADARRRTDARTQAEKVVAFEANGNTMAAVRQIAEGTDLTRNPGNALLHNSSQKDLFQSLKVGPKRKQLWRLREGENDEDSEMSLQELAEMG